MEKGSRINQKLKAFLLSLLMLMGQLTPTLAYVEAKINGNLINVVRTVQPKGGAIPIKQVDMGTGNVTLQESLLGVEGYMAKLSYNSEGVAQKAITWNRSQKQGLMGLGWEFPRNRIIRMTKQTGSLEDDTYLLYMEGASYPLTFIDEKPNEKKYRIKKQHDWIVKHDTEQDQWQVYMPNGKVFIFGDGTLIEHASNSVEYNVKWGNWIGSSVITTNQSQLPISYNLSAIEDIYGEQVQFFYNKESEQVGEGLYHTRSSHIDKIVGLRGKTMNFIYADKNQYEYNDPHTENGLNIPTNDKDAYQERYETKMLSAIELMNREDVLQQRIGFEYSLLKEDTELQKRLLTKINFFDSEGDQYKPSLVYEYFGLDSTDGVYADMTADGTRMYNSVNGALYGVIKQETRPEGVSYAYYYGQKEITEGSKSIEINFPDFPVNPKYDVTSKWTAPELFYGPDYVVAIFESQDLDIPQSYVKVYQWVGDKWLEDDIGKFDGYFYDRYFSKDQYSKGVLSQAKKTLFDNGSKLIPVATGALNGVNDALKDIGKTFYKTGEDISEGNVGKAIEDWVVGELTLLKDITEDLLASFEDEARAIEHVFDELTGNKEALFKDRQRDLYDARVQDESDNPRKVYHVTLQDKFFAMTTSMGGEQVVISRKNELVAGKWITSPEKTKASSKFFTLDSGDNFVVLLDELTDILYLYSWDGLVWDTALTTLVTDFNKTIISGWKNNIERDLNSLLGGAENSENRLDHRSAISAKNNMILAVITDSHGVNAEATIFHHDENMNWSSNAEQINKKGVVLNKLGTQQKSDNLAAVLLGKDGKIDLKVGNSFAVLQTYDNLDENLPDPSSIPLIGSLISDFVPDGKKTNSTYGIVWDEDFDNIHITYLNSGIGQTGVESFIVGDVINKIGRAHSLLIGSNNALFPDDGKNYAFRFNGEEFLANEFDSPYYTSGFSNDVTSTLTESSDKAYKTPQFYQFDPNTDQWGQITNASQERISAPEFVDEAINVAVEVVNIIVQVVTLCIPVAGEVLELAESTMQTLKTVESVANIAGVVAGVVGPISEEIVKGMMGTNHKSTSISNNFISVNGKLFHRNPSGTWELKDNGFFETQAIDHSLVGGTNNIVDDYIPYTIETNEGIENHIKLLRNGGVYNSKTITASEYAVHQDSLSTTIGPGAYVSYGPVASNGFVQENEYVKQFLPTFDATADLRDRRTRPSYKDATEVVLHKITGISLDDELYDYPVTKVAIKEAETELGYHYFQYDMDSAAYNSHSQVTFYGKVTDIPSSRLYPLNSVIDLTQTDGGYVEHYYYNRNNFYGTDLVKGHPAEVVKLKLTDSELVTYQSVYEDDIVSFSKEEIAQLDGHSYASLIYDTSQKIVSADHTYYNVWEEDLRHQLTGDRLNETRIYDVRAVKKVNIVDDVVNTTQYEYGFTPLTHNLVLKKKSIDGLGSNMEKETHVTSFIYASEYYHQLRAANRVNEPMITIQSVGGVGVEEIVTGSQVTAYDEFQINDKTILAPKHFYRSLHSDYQQNGNLEIPNVADIITDIASNDQHRAQYDIAVADYEVKKGDYEAANIAILDGLHAENELDSEIHQLNAEMHELASDIDDYHELIAVDQGNIGALQANIDILSADISDYNNQITDKRSQISNLNRQISNKQMEIRLSWIGGPLIGAITTGIIESQINKLRDSIKSLQVGINQLMADINQKRLEINQKRDEMTAVLSDQNELKNKLQALNDALANETVVYKNFKDGKAIHISNSAEALKGDNDSLSLSKHQLAKLGLDDMITDGGLHQSYVTALTDLESKLTLSPRENLPPPNSLPDYDMAFQDKTKEKIVELKNKLNEYKINSQDLANDHSEVISHGEGLKAITDGFSYDYNPKWIKTKTIESRDATTGIPIVWTDAEETTSSIVLDPNHKKPMVSYQGVNAYDTNQKTVYFGFEDGVVPEMFKNQATFDNESYTGKKSIQVNNVLGSLTELTEDSETAYIVSARVKAKNTPNNNAVFQITGGNKSHTVQAINDSWTYVEFLLEKNEKPRIDVTGELLIDDLLVRPIDTKTKINIWDDDGKLSHSIGNNGITVTHLYDDAQQPIASIDNTGKVVGYNRHYFSRDNETGEYISEQPNSNISIGFQEHGNLLGDKTGTTLVSANQLSSTYGMSFIGKDSFTLTQGDFSLQRVGGNLTITNAGVDEDITIGDKKNFLIIQLQNGKYIYVDGKLIKQFDTPSPTATEMSIAGSISKLFIGQSPVVSVHYMDSVKRVIQHQHLYNDEDNTITGKIIRGTIYNGWGKPIVHSKPVFNTDTSLSYDPDFITYRYLDGKVSGTLKTFYEGTSITDIYDKETNFDAATMFYKTDYSNDALQRITKTIKPGLNNTDLLNTTQLGYQDLIGKGLETAIGISENDALQFVTTSVQKRNSTTARVKDVFGRITGAKEGSAISKQQYLYSPSSPEMTTNQHLPLSFTEENSTEYINFQEKYDLLGDVMREFNIDEGNKYIIKNKKGFPVFISAGDHSPTTENLQWVYIKYDNLDRPVSSGVATVSGLYNINKMRLLANTPEWLGDVKIRPQKGWTYDTSSDQVNNSLGRITQKDHLVNGSRVITNYEYDTLGHLTSKTTTIGTETPNTIAYSYYTDGKLKTITYPNETQVNYSYDVNGRLYGIGTDTNAFIYAKYRYGFNDKMTKEILNDGQISSVMTYTLQEQLKKNRTKVVGSDVNLFKENLKYVSGAGNYQDGHILEKNETLATEPASKSEYTYDDQYQLTAVNKTKGTDVVNYQYVYDVNGNLLSATNDVSKEVEVFSHEPGTNKRSSDQITADQEGLYTLIGSSPLSTRTAIEYDSMTNMAVNVYDHNPGGDKTVSYLYDTDNNRVQKIRKNESADPKIDDKLTYVVGTRNLPVYESYQNVTNNDNWDKVYIYNGGHSPIAMLHKGKTYFFIRDYQYSLRVLVDGTDSSIVKQYSYGPYGEVQSSINKAFGSEYSLATYLYTGQEYEEEIDVYNFKARLYHPDQKVFLQPDPKRINYSPYTFVHNNPVNYIDVYGKAPTSTWKTTWSESDFQVVKGYGDTAIQRTRSYLTSGIGNQIQDVEASGGESGARVRQYTRELARLEKEYSYLSPQYKYAVMREVGGGNCQQCAEGVYSELGEMGASNVVREPIFMSKFVGVDHAFVTIGDQTDIEPIVVDAWAVKPEVHTLSENTFWNENAQLIQRNRMVDQTMIPNASTTVKPEFRYNYNNRSAFNDLRTNYPRGFQDYQQRWDNRNNPESGFWNQVTTGSHNREGVVPMEF